MTRAFAPSRFRFRGEGKGRIASLAVRTYVCDGCGLQAAASKPAQCRACGRMDFLSFDSRSEANRWATLELMRAAGEISELRRQVRFPLLAPGPDGAPKQVGHYVADFAYLDHRSREIVEDCKGEAMTDLASWKLRHFHAQYGVEVKLTKGG